MTTSSARISAADANRHFSKLLGRVKAGETVVITSRGTPVATLAPADDAARLAAEKAEAERQADRKALFDRLRSQPPSEFMPWTRDELYETEPWRS